MLTVNLAKAVPAVVAVLSLAACGGSGHPAAAHKPAPPSAMALAQKVPGTSGCQHATPDVESIGDVTCQLGDGSYLEIATFANSADERQWIANGGTGSPPDPSYAGCCIQGNLWAATLGAPDYVDTGANLVTPAIGGRVVNG